MNTRASSLDPLLLGRLVAGLFVAVSALTGLHVALVPEAAPHDERAIGASLLGAGWGLGMLLRPPTSPRVLLLASLVAAPLVAFGMSGFPPEYAPLGIVYFVWLANFTALFQPPRVAALAAAWYLLCYVAWSALTTDRSLVMDATFALNTIGLSTAAMQLLARRWRPAEDASEPAPSSADGPGLVDELTGLGTRRAFDLEAAARAGTERLGGFLLLDIDEFRAINEEYGREVGDQVLAGVARRIAESVRRQDFVARLSRDAFAVILEGPLTVPGLRRVADVVQGATSAHAVETAAGYIRVATSIGGALVSSEVPLARVVPDARARAERALAAARSAGGNCALLDGETRAPARRGRRRTRPRAA